MPDVVASAHIVEEAWEPLLGDLGGVDDCAGDIDENGFHEGGVEVHCPFGAADEVELQDRYEAGEGEGDVEGDAGPCHVLTVECWVPWEDCAGDAEDDGQRHVDAAGDGFTVECCPFGREDGACHEETDARVIDASESFEKRFVCDPVHGVPHYGTDKALGGSEEEERSDGDVGFGGERECG